MNCFLHDVKIIPNEWRSILLNWVGWQSKAYRTYFFIRWDRFVFIFIPLFFSLINSSGHFFRNKRAHNEKLKVKRNRASRGLSRSPTQNSDSSRYTVAGGGGKILPVIRSGNQNYITFRRKSFYLQFSFVFRREFVHNLSSLEWTRFFSFCSDLKICCQF